MSSAFVSQCKVQLRLAVSRLKLQRNKKINGIKNSKYEVAELLRKGNDESARIKVESIIREDFVIEAFDILELLCETILARLPLMQLSKECPAELREAISTVIYAAPRTEVKELVTARVLFIKYYGKPFGQAAMDNSNGSVNARVMHKLSVLTPEPFLVYQYLTEIARAHNVDWCPDDHCDSSCTSPSLAMPPPTFSPTAFPPSVPTFPSVPPSMPSFPSVPPSGGAPGFPDFPKFPPPASGGPSFPQFPSVPPSQPQFPSVPPSQPQFPSVPPSQPQFPSFPTPPSSNSPQFPSVPKNNTPQFPDFPAPPSATPGMPQFPSVPKHPGADFPQFPSFPSPPTQNSQPPSNGLPQFPSVPPSQPPSNSPQFPSFPTPPGGQNPSFSSNNGMPQFPSVPNPAHVHDELDDLPEFSASSRFPSVPSSDTLDSELDLDAISLQFPSVPKHNLDDFSFPSVPKDNSSDGFPSFPSVPKHNSSDAFPSFPQPPNSSSGGFPQFPAAPSSPNPPHQSQPNGFPQFPAAPSSTTSPPTTQRSNGFPQFPAAPSSTTSPPTTQKSNAFPQFPSAPSTSNPPNNNGFPQFPTTPSSPNPPPSHSSNSNGFPQFPAPPSAHSSTIFPSEDTTNVPDFDDLTARFEEHQSKNIQLGLSSPSSQPLVSLSDGDLHQLYGHFRKEAGIEAEEFLLNSVDVAQYQFSEQKMVWDEIDKFIKEYSAQVDPKNYEHMLQSSLSSLHHTHIKQQQDMHQQFSSRTIQPAQLQTIQPQHIHPSQHLQQFQSLQQLSPPQPAQPSTRPQQAYYSPEQPVHVSKKRQNFSREITQILTDWLTAHYDHPYPSEQEKEALGQKVGLKEKEAEEGPNHEHV